MRDNKGSGIPLGFAPDGGPVHDPDELPLLPPPSRIVVARYFYEIDGWVFPFSPVSKRSLLWLRRTVDAWIVADGSAENQRWIGGFLEAFEEALIAASSHRKQD